MSQDVMICVMNSTAVFDDVHVEMQSSEFCVKCLDLNAELLKKQNAYNDLSKKYFEHNDLKAQLQAKDTTILKEHIKSMRENDKEEKVNHEMDEIETINIELEHSVAKLLFENKRLHENFEHLKKIYKDHSDSIKKTRALSKEHHSELYYFTVTNGNPSSVNIKQHCGDSGFGIGEVVLSTFEVLQMLSFFLQMGFTLILATLDGLDVGLLGDVIGEDDCDEDE
ncbi:hypothetical protein Tco_0910705 [Tanacetum coccineum]|uniref:Uncharacterized protein n=1 Tax=Tanacetum coccineum TaxID=301880 RepID=A0ABQ5CUT4_9ASTR